MSAAKCLHNVPRVKNWGGALICPECHRDWDARYYRKSRIKIMLKQASIRAERLGIPFKLTEADVFIPTHCPVLGIELKLGTKTERDASPSLDRFIPQLGYVPGNVFVISYRANRLKSDGTFKEHELLTKWMAGVHEALWKLRIA